MSLVPKRLAAAVGVAWGRRYDALTLAGAGAVAVGVAYIYFPAGIIVAGLVLGIWGAIGSWTDRKKAR